MYYFSTFVDQPIGSKSKSVCSQETISFQAEESIGLPDPIEEDSMEEPPIEDRFCLKEPRTQLWPFIWRSSAPSGASRSWSTAWDTRTQWRRGSRTVKKRKPYATYWVCSVCPKNARCSASVIQRNGDYRHGNITPTTTPPPPTIGATQSLTVQADVRQKATKDKFTSAGILMQEALTTNMDPGIPDQALPKISNLVSMHTGVCVVAIVVY